MVEEYKVEVKATLIKSVDFSDDLTIVTEKSSTCLFHKD